MDPTKTGGFGKRDIYYSKYIDGKYQEGINLGSGINTKENDGAFVSPDESFMILAYKGKDSFGGSDLYIRFKMKNGEWSKPYNLGPDVNSPKEDECPRFSPDWKFMFFSSFRFGNPDIMWVSTNVFNKFNPENK